MKWQRVTKGKPRVILIFGKTQFVDDRQSFLRTKAASLLLHRNYKYTYIFPTQRHVAMIGVCFVIADFSQTVVSCRNQPVKKLTMGYITNYSYCTVMVSSTINYCSADTCKYIKHKLWSACIKLITIIINIPYWNFIYAIRVWTLFYGIFFYVFYFLGFLSF